jgi:ectoine hydroxylase-related dioxygenase (phytanoyl-CoA dioxygenase family)
MLTKQQVEQYHAEGAIVVPGVMDKACVHEMNTVLAQLVEESRQVSSHNDIYDLEPGHTADEPRVRRIKKPHLVHPVFHDFARSTRLTACLHALLGDAARLYGTKLNLKSPGYGSAVEWHQDWAFYPHTNQDVLAVGVMLNDTTTSNGAMLVIPGTHTGPTFDHHDAEGYFCGAMDPEDCGLDFSTAVACEGPAGSCSFHHVRLVHGSAQNISDKPRGLLLYEVAAADAYPLMGIAHAYGNYEAYNERLLYGSPTVTPRFDAVAAPVRMPLPPAKNQGSIYENQLSGKSFFSKRI